MKIIKTMATINEQGQPTLDIPLLTNQNSRVEASFLFPKMMISMNPLKQKF
jgi:hypothetical protein